MDYWRWNTTSQFSWLAKRNRPAARAAMESHLEKMGRFFAEAQQRKHDPGP
jgi:hypothetical protein